MIKIKVFFIVFLLISQLKQQSLQESRNKYCQTDQDLVGRSDLQKQLQREKIQNYFSTRFQKVVDYYINNNSSSILASFAPLAAFIIIFLILSFISGIIFVLLVLKKLQQPEENVKKQILLTSSFVFLLIFFVLFIVYCIFFSLSTNKIDNVRCGIFLLPSSFLDGINNQQIKFIGAKGMQQIYQNLNNEIPNLSKNRIDFNRIKNADISGSSNTAMQSLDFFQKKYMNRKTINSQGILKVPFTAQFLQPEIIVAVQSDFSNMVQTGLKSNQAAVEGYRILEDVPQFQKIAQDTSQILNISVQAIENFFLNLSNKSNKGLRFIRGSQIALLIFYIIAMIISFLIIFILFNITKKQEMINLKHIARILILILMIIVFVIFLINIFLGIGSSSVSGFCYFLGSISQGNMDYLRSIEPTINPFILSIIETCYSPNGDGNVSQIINSDDPIIQMQDKILTNFVQGVSVNQYFYDNTEGITESRQLPMYQQQLDNYKTGIEKDHFTIQQSIDTLNNLINCNNSSFALNSKNCSSNTNCQGIYETEAFQAPSCSQDQSQANQIFDNLKLYLSQQNSMIEEMQRELTEPKYSPQKSYSKASEGMNQVKQNFQNIQRSIPNTLASFQSFGEPLHQIYNCQALQIQIDQYEQQLCFQFSRYVFVNTILTFFMGLNLFILAWILWFAFRGDDLIEPSQIDLNETQELNLKDTDFVVSQFEEDEKVPVV